MFVSAPAARYWVMTKSSIETAKHDGRAGQNGGREQRQQYAEQPVACRRAEVGRGLLVLGPDRDEPAAHDDDDVGDRERHLADDLRPASPGR